MGIISCDSNIIGWQQLRSRPKVLGTYIEIFVHVNTHDQKNFWFGLSHDNYLKKNTIKKCWTKPLLENRYYPCSATTQNAETMAKNVSKREMI